MAITTKQANDKERNRIMNLIVDFLKEQGEDVQQTKAYEHALPFVNENGEEGWLRFPISIPSGSREGEPYDGYAEAESYQMLIKKKKEDAKKKAEAKKKKMEKDKKMRDRKAQQKAERES